MLKFALIFLGSGAGGVCRYAMSKWVQKACNWPFPVGTLAVNLLGCLLIGFLSAAMLGRVEREDIRLAITVGFIGGFTTFSAFGMETVIIMQRGQQARAAAYVAASVVSGLVCVWAGYRFGQSTFLHP